MSIEGIVNQKQNYEELLLHSTTESARLIYAVIQSNQNIQAKEIIQKVHYSARTVRYSLKVLLNLGLIKQIPNLQDCRSHFYQTTLIN